MPRRWGPPPTGGPPTASALPDPDRDEAGVGEVGQALGEPIWRSGLMVQQTGTNCSVLNAASTEPMIGSYVAYLGDPNGAAPEVGDVFMARVHVVILGNPCTDGVVGIGVTLQLPAGVDLATGPQHRVRCLYYRSSGAGTDDVSDSDRCVATPTRDGAGWGLGSRLLPRAASSRSTSRSPRRASSVWPTGSV